ncbi:hypothetical protein LentiSH36_01505 [Lentibacter algarum]|uniref:Uncharacterized protein n=1 Tax=Lentibacter algarum TaxID=576131 RepID=A0A1H3KFE6_9RHOB|nr:hypothetical protein LentiSH36_01505 [Lentibacter algarum]SDY50867.1 hypothetical protein SAMN05444486_102516 [Lentibacter algarum]
MRAQPVHKACTAKTGFFLPPKRKRRARYENQMRGVC